MPRIIGFSSVFAKGLKSEHVKADINDSICKYDAYFVEAFEEDVIPVFPTMFSGLLIHREDCQDQGH
jgi:hypothetical protein